MTFEVMEEHGSKQTGLCFKRIYFMAPSHKGEVQEAGGLCCVFMKQHSSILHMACLNPLLPTSVSVSPWKLESTLYTVPCRCWLSWDVTWSVCNTLSELSQLVQVKLLFSLLAHLITQGRITSLSPTDP